MFDSPALEHALAGLIGSLSGQRLIVAYSGGGDSTVLLHALHGLRRRLAFELVAAHFNHRLYPESTAWQAHCRRLCAAWQIPLLTQAGRPPSTHPHGPEAAARACRYRWFNDVAQAGDVLCTAHHADDQVETVLLNLMRGGGAAQLAGIPAQRSLSATGQTRLARPLLAFSQHELHQYAQQHRLECIQDASNQDTRFDRNYLRHRIIPQLQQRWPGLRSAVASSAREVAQADAALQHQARRLLTQAQGTAARRVLCLNRPLHVPVLLEAADFLVAMAIRCWLHEVGMPAPGRRQLTELIRQLRANPCGAAVLATARCTLRQYQRQLYCSHALCLRRAQHSIAYPLQWPISLADGWQLCRVAVEQHGLEPSALASEQARLVWRQGGERVKLPGSSHTSELKKRLQQQRVPPWGATAIAAAENRRAHSLGARTGGHGRLCAAYLERLAAGGAAMRRALMQAVCCTGYRPCRRLSGAFRGFLLPMKKARNTEPARFSCTTDRIRRRFYLWFCRITCNPL